MTSRFERARATVAGAIAVAAPASLAGAEAQASLRAAAQEASGAAAEPGAPLDADGRALVGHTVQWVLDRALREAVEANACVLEHGGALVPGLLSAALAWADAGLCEPSLVFALLEDLVAGSTLADCEAVFSWLESHAAQVAPFFTKGKMLMLRAANDLLRRLSKANDTVLCGRVVMLLATLYPLSERSALNVKGNFNPANVTEFEEIDGDGEAAGEGGVDAAFHARFWKLQALFAAPMLPLTKPTRFVELTMGVNAALEAFDAVHVATPAVIVGGEQQGEGGGTRIGAKYLTSRRLLSLQVRDGAFRQHFLCQCLILFRFLLSPGDKKGALKLKQVQAIEALQARVLGALKETTSKSKEESKRFVAAVQESLSREVGWAAWKAAGCKSLERAPEAPKESAKPPMKRRRLRGAAPLFEVSSLWTAPQRDHEAFVASDARKPVPLVAEHLQPLAEQLDPDAGIDEEYMLKNDKMWCWKALRLIGRTNWSAFQKATKHGVDHVCHRFVEGAPKVEAKVEAKVKAEPTEDAKE